MSKDPTLAEQLRELIAKQREDGFKPTWVGVDITTLELLADALDQAEQALEEIHQIADAAFEPPSFDAIDEIAIAALTRLREGR